MKTARNTYHFENGYEIHHLSETEMWTIRHPFTHETFHICTSLYKAKKLANSLPEFHPTWD